MKDHGIVKEQWETAGAKIEYTKSKEKRGGWHIPAPLNLEDDDDVNINEDDLNPGEGTPKLAR